METLIRGKKQQQQQWLEPLEMRQQSCYAESQLEASASTDILI